MKKLLAYAVVMMLGIVDQVHDDYALIEYKAPTGELRYLNYRVDMIPCEVSEGLKVQVEQLSPRRNKVFCSI